MRNTLAILGKEFRTYFTNPMAYIIAAVYLAMSGFFFVQDISTLQMARLQGLLGPSGFLLLLIAPILTMRLFAEEQKMGTLELLLTAPVREVEVVLGKFLAALSILAVMILLTAYYPIILMIFGNPDVGPILSGYLGLFLAGACFLAVGLLASSFTSNQILAAILGIGLLLLFWLISGAASMVPQYPAVRDVLNFVSLGGHYSDFLRGIIDSKHVIYYVTFAATCLFFTVRSLETRRWR